MKILFPGLDSAVILRGRSRQLSKIRRPPDWGPSFIGSADARTPVLLYLTKSLELRQAEYFGPLPDVVCFAIVENLNGTGTNILQGGTYFNRYVVEHLVNVTAL